MLVLVLVMALVVSCSGGIVSLTTEQEIHKFLDSYEAAWRKLSRADLEDHIEDSETKFRITHPDFVALASMYQFPYNTGVDDDGNPITADENIWHLSQALLFSLLFKNVNNFKLLDRNIQVDSTKTSAVSLPAAIAYIYSTNRNPRILLPMVFLPLWYLAL